MRIISTQLTAQEVGDNWRALENGPQNAIDQNIWIPQNIQSQTVKMWLKGVTITGTVVASNDDSRVTPKPAASYKAGLIQLITRQPIMRAIYEHPKRITWEQRHIPCYDCRPDSVPWYLDVSQSVLQDGTVNFTLQDYPTTTVNIRLNGKRLQSLHKSLEFIVYLAVTPAIYQGINTRNEMYIHQKLTWKCETHLTFNWRQDDSYKYNIKTFTRRAEAAQTVTPNESRQLVGALPLSYSSANAEITQRDLT